MCLQRVFLYLGSLLFSALLRLKRGVTVRGRVIVRGWPHVDVRRGTRLVLEDGVMLNSSNFAYHVNMHSPVKLLLDEPGAEITIGRNTRIHGTCLHARERITVGENCLIAGNCQIIDCSGHDLSFDDVANRLNTRGTSRPVTIGDNVWIGANSIVLPGVTIGEGSVVAAGSVVVKDIPRRCVAGGNPAKVIRVADE